MSYIPEELLQKHKAVIEAARNYYVYHRPTGFSDEYYNRLEADAQADGLEPRDYVFQEIAGTRYPNEGYIGKVEKEQVPKDMYTSIQEYTAWYVQTYGEEPLYLLKYDGSSLVAYYDPSTGKVTHVVTAGGTNRTSEGIEWTEKFKGFFPELPGTGIKALQCECLVSLEHGFGETSRQKANGLVNSAVQPLSFKDWTPPKGSKLTAEEEYQRYLHGYTRKNGTYVPGFYHNQALRQAEIDSVIDLRCFRLYLDDSIPHAGYWETFCGLPMSTDRVPAKFSPAWVMTPSELLGLGPEIVNKDIWATPTGTFMVDGIVAYSASTGECVRALKYKDAGRGEAVEVLDIRWNNQAPKGKDSWSANAIISPVTIRGSVITKPTIGSVKKMITTGISPGAKVTLILANSTIPAISEVLSPGNGNYGWPVCGCGYQMSGKDIYGSLLKCGNPMCTERLGRMRKYLGGLTNWKDINLDKFLIIDRTKLSEKPGLLENLIEGIKNGATLEETRNTLAACLTTELQKRNLDLVTWPAWTALNEYKGILF